MNYIPALLLCCVTLPGTLLCQDPDKTGKVPNPVAGTTEEGFADEKAQETGDEHAVKGRPTGRTDLPRFCDFIGSARPSPLPPGATGTFNVIAILKGDGVISDASNLKLDYQRQQGPLTLGEPIWPVARQGKLAAAFQGRPVFEDTMVVAIPVSVGAGTAFGNFPVQANVSATLTQGSNGAAIGELKTLVTATVNVGPAAVLLNVPGKSADAGQTANESRAPTAGEVAAPAPEDAPEPAAAEPPRPTGQALTPSPPADQEHTPLPQDQRAPQPEQGGMSLLLMVGGGFVLLVAIVLLLAKKK